MKLDSHMDGLRRDWIGQFGIYLHKRRLEILTKLLQDKRYTLSLDIGTSAIGMLSTLGLLNVVGTDIRLGKAVQIRTSAEYLPFRSSSFDLVFAGEVLEHLSQPGQALTDWSRVLKQGGTMIVSTPNGILVNPRTNPEHARTYAPSDVVRCLERIGLRVNYTRGIFTGLVSGRRMFRLIFTYEVKMALLRFPVPLAISYDVFFEGMKE